jgi:hypothetical protein
VTRPELHRLLADVNNRDDIAVCFVQSHYKVEAAGDARHLKDRLVGLLGAPVFLDSDDLLDLRELLRIVVRMHPTHQSPPSVFSLQYAFSLTRLLSSRMYLQARSDVLLLLQTSNVLTRAWCLLELYTAILNHGEKPRARNRYTR